MREFPIISVDEPEMLKTYQEYMETGFEPLSVKVRSFLETETGSEVIEEIPVPREFGKTYGNNPIHIRKISLTDNYGKKINFNGRNTECLEKFIEWYLGKFPSCENWDSRVEQIEFKIIKENRWNGCFLRFKRGVSMKLTGENNIYSLIWNGIKKPNIRSWLDEEKFSDAEMKEQTEGIADSYCTITYRESESKSPHCRL